MAVFLSESRLRQYSDSIFEIKLGNLGSIAEGKTTRTNGVFLSHSHEDKDLVLPAISFLTSHGVPVYVDWQDDEMPQNISTETAEKLREKIKEYAKFIVLVTERSKNSKWVPWELGVADGHKPIQQIAILPVDRTGEKFTGNEYLGLYPQIEYYRDRWLVWQPKTVYTYLPEWLQRAGT